MPLDPTSINWDYLKPLIPLKNQNETKEVSQNNRNTKFLIAVGLAIVTFAGVYIILNFNRNDEE
jgi:hypothetical protein